jgi:uncharacterized protein (DUF2147 family)
MKRFSCVILLMLLSSTAHAREYSFSIGGHRIHIEAARHCRSLSCVSWSEFGIRRSQDDEAVTPALAKPVAVAPACAPAPAAAPAVAAPSAAPAPVPPPPISAPPLAPVRAQIVPAPVTPAPAPLVQPAPVPAPVKPPPVVLAQAPTTTIELAAANAQPAPKVEAAVGKPKEKATVEATVTDKPVETPDWAADWTPPATDTPASAKVAEKPTKVVTHDDDTPVGDWQTEGKTNLVRIESCGAALCGFVLDAATHTKGESVLINMKPKNDTEWTGNVYSRASGNSYYGTMTLKDGKTLRVEACALGAFFCSGNNWTRIEQKPASADDLISSHETAARVRS